MRPLWLASQKVHVVDIVNVLVKPKPTHKVGLLAPETRSEQTPLHKAFVLLSQAKLSMLSVKVMGTISNDMEYGHQLETSFNRTESDTRVL